MIEYFTNNLWSIWACISILCLVLELFSGDCFLICIAISAAVAAVSTVFGVGLYVQIAIACISAVVCLAAIRPKLIQLLHKGEDARVSNADAIIGRTATVSQDIPANGYGRVAIDGDDWKAQSNADCTLQKGDTVRIIQRDSIILTVKKL